MKLFEHGSSLVWDRRAPHGAPFPDSRRFRGIRATGRFTSYTRADTWYPSWGADDQLYSPFTDGYVLDVFCNSAEGDERVGGVATTGHVTIRGSDPLDLQMTHIGIHAASASPYGGRYPSASLSHDGTWYYGTYCLADAHRGLNWDILGPFVGFRTSADGGRSWMDTSFTPDRTLFRESAVNGQPVRMGAPHFADLGKNMAYSSDGYAYLVGHGSRSRAANLSWISGDELTLARVKPSLTTINDPTAYEWAAGHGTGGAEKWMPSLSDAQPIARWPGHMGCATITYLKAYECYLMCVTDGWPTIKTMDSYILESDSLFGPWKMLAYMDSFGEQGYFLNFPSKFISADGSELWLCYSANFTNGSHGTTFAANPPGSRYGMCLLEVALLPAS